MKNSLMDWVLFLASLLLASSGPFILSSAKGQKELALGLSCLVFFGLCALSIGHTLWARRQNRAHGQDLRVTLAPGALLKMSKARNWLLGAALAFPGALFFWYSWLEHSVLMMALSGLMVLVGLFLMGLLALGLASTGFLLFEKEGLRLGDHQGSVLMEWENIRELIPTEYNHNQVVVFGFVDPQALAATAKGTSKKWTPEGVLKEMAKSRKWLGCDWMIFTGMYGLNPVLLAKALATYVRDPAVREGLERRLLDK